jgi:hypothetical protein
MKVQVGCDDVDGHLIVRRPFGVRGHHGMLRGEGGEAGLLLLQKAPSLQ